MRSRRAVAKAPRPDLRPIYCALVTDFFNGIGPKQTRSEKVAYDAADPKLTSPLGGRVPQLV